MAVIADLNSVIGCGDKLYYDINPNTKMDVPSSFYVMLETKYMEWMAYLETGGKLNFYDYCKDRLGVKTEEDG